jgi:hypothetical protein
MRGAKNLLAAAERALCAGETTDAAEMFRQICDLYPGTMESLAAVCYLHSARRCDRRR